MVTVTIANYFVYYGTIILTIYFDLNVGTSEIKFIKFIIKLDC